MGHIVEDVDEQVVPHDGKDVDLSIDSKIQYIAYTNLKAAVEKFKAKAGAAMVLDVRTGEVLALVNYPTLQPERPLAPDRRAAAQPHADRHLRAGLDHEAVHGVARARSAPRHADYTGRYGGRPLCARRCADHRRQRVRRADGRRRDPEVEQHRRDEDRHAAQARRDVEHVHQHRSRPGAEGRLPGRGGGPSASVEELAPHRAGDHVVRLRPVGVAVPVGPRVHRDRARRRDHAGVDFPHAGRSAGHGPADFRADHRSRSARDARNRHGAGRHVAGCGSARLSRRRQERYRVQARRARLRPLQVPRFVRRHGADAESAHRRRRDGRRTDGGQPLRRSGVGSGVLVDRRRHAALAERAAGYAGQADGRVGRFGACCADAHRPRPQRSRNFPPAPARRR